MRYLWVISESARQVSERSGASCEERAERSEPVGVQGTPHIQEKCARQVSNLRPPV